MPNSTIICLIPDLDYRFHRPEITEPHLTLGYFNDTPDSEVIQLRKVAGDLVGSLMGAVPAAVAGYGVFVVPEIGENGGYALVDLIDGYPVLRARHMVEELANGHGLKVDRTHGFTPHMTTEFLYQWPSYLDDRVKPERFTFKFRTVGVWSRDKRWEIPLD